MDEHCSALYCIQLYRAAVMSAADRSCPGRQVPKDSTRWPLAQCRVRCRERVHAHNALGQVPCTNVYAMIACACATVALPDPARRQHNRSEDCPPWMLEASARSNSCTHVCSVQPSGALKAPRHAKGHAHVPSRLVTHSVYSLLAASAHFPAMADWCVFASSLKGARTPRIPSDWAAVWQRSATACRILNQDGFNITCTNLRSTTPASSELACYFHLEVPFNRVCAVPLQELESLNGCLSIIQRSCARYRLVHVHHLLGYVFNDT